MDFQITILHCLIKLVSNYCSEHIEDSLRIEITWTNLFFSMPYVSATHVKIKPSRRIRKISFFFHFDSTRLIWLLSRTKLIYSFQKNPLFKGSFYIFTLFYIHAKNIHQKLGNYLETHDKFWSYVLFSKNSIYFTI